jgi:glycosyltransferase involved in cell wall biosynthesis
MKIVWVTDADIKGSGYRNLSIPLCEGLVAKGHNVKVIGIGYKGEEHNLPFSLLPASNFQEVFAMIQNLWNMTQFEVLIVALDVPLQEMFLRQLQQRPFKYLGLMPIEADPLCASWAMVLMWMDKACIISKFGTEEAKKVGINAEYIEVGIDTSAWRLPTTEERTKIRKSLFGADDDTFVILTVADNQERKNLSAGMEIFKEFNKEVPNSRYALVTREYNQVGWRLRDYAQVLGINNNFLIFERGMDFTQLWATYAGADCFLLTSKAEGLGLPLLEAMAIGLPCVATDATGMKELLSDGRGFLVDPEYIHVDPFGNGHRYWINKYQTAKCLDMISRLSDENVHLTTDKARQFVEQRHWQIGIDKLDEVLKGL